MAKFAAPMVSLTILLFKGMCMAFVPASFDLKTLEFSPSLLKLLFSFITFKCHSFHIVSLCRGARVSVSIHMCVHKQVHV